MRDQITNKTISIFKNIGYEVTPETLFKDLKGLGMINVGLLGDEIEYEFNIIISIADLKHIFKGSVQDMADWIYTKILIKECD
jgi:hypothetical protein